MPGHPLGGDGAEGVAGDPDPGRIEPASEGPAGLAVERLEPIEDGRHVAVAIERRREIDRLPERRQALGEGKIAPHRLVAAGMLEEDNAKTPGRPVAAEVGIALAGAAETMAEEDHWRGAGVAGEPDADGDRPLAGIVNHVEIDRPREDSRRFDREGIVGRISRMRHRHHSETGYSDEKSKQGHGRPSRVVAVMPRAVPAVGEVAAMPAVLPWEGHRGRHTRADQADDDQQ